MRCGTGRIGRRGDVSVGHPRLGRKGKERQVRKCVARNVELRWGLAGKSRHVPLRKGLVVFGMAGSDR